MRRDRRIYFVSFIRTLFLAEIRSLDAREQKDIGEVRLIVGVSEGIVVEVISK